MREAQAEIQAIEAQLRSIQANPGPPLRLPPTIVESSGGLANRRDRRGSYPTQHPADGAPSRTAATAHSSQRNSSPTHRPPQLSQTGSAGDRSAPQATAVQTQRAQLAATVERLQQQSAHYVQQYRQLQTQVFQPTDQVLDRSLQLLEAQVQHINQLSAVQEAAILELKTIAEQIEQDWNAFEQLQSDYEGDAEQLPICDYVSAVVPKIERNADGVYVISSRSIDLFKAEREAALTAQALRHWSERDKALRGSRSGASSPWRWLRTLLGVQQSSAAGYDAPPQSSNRAAYERGSAPLPPAAAPASRSRRSARRRSAWPLRESVALFLAAVLTRVGLDLVLTTFPVLLTPAIALLVTPAAIAVYRTSHTPHAGFVWSCRLLVIMIGLLLGGRL
jgi:hypothetical protein